MTTRTNAPAYMPGFGNHFSTEGYASKASAQNAIESIKKNGPGAPTEDNS